MLAKANRIVSGADFRRIVRTGRRQRSAFAIVYTAKPESQEARFGFVITKQVGGAVVRNRVKRRLASVVHEHLPLLAHRDVVIRALPAAGNADFATLNAGISAQLERR